MRTTISLALCTLLLGACTKNDKGPTKPEASFSITRVERPATIVSGGPKGDLKVHWAGTPVFPLKLRYRPTKGGCPPATGCLTVEMTFPNKTNPLVYPGAVWCTGRTQPASFGYEVVLVDATGATSAPSWGGFRCKLR